MILIYKGYIAKTDPVVTSRFNLYEVKPLTATKDIPAKGVKEGETYTYEKNIGYGYRYENLIRKIVELELNRQERTIPLSQYITEFNQVLKQVTLKQEEDEK